MAVFGLKEHLDNRVATIVVAADTVEEFNKWFTDVEGQPEGDRLYNEIYTSSVLDALTRDQFKGFKHHVYAFFHDTEEQREEFVAQQKIVEQKTHPARDRQADMLHKHKEKVREETETDEDRNRTIEERLGLDKNDPWDRRSEEEREQDRQLKEEMKRLRQEGTVSSDSFADPEAIREQRIKDRLKDALSGKMSETMARDQLKDLGNGTAAEAQTIDGLDAQGLKDALTAEGVDDVDILSDEAYQGVIDAIKPPVQTQDAQDANAPVAKVTDIKTSVNADGSVNVDSITAVKRGGPVDEGLQAANQKEAEELREAKLGGRRSFSPDDFAKVLAGDGSSDALGIPSNDPVKREGPSRGSLSDHAEAARAAHQETLKEAAEQARAVVASESSNSVEPNTRSVTLTPRMWEVIESHVERGMYENADEVIREAVRQLMF